jgi:hypothetical protein
MSSACRFTPTFRRIELSWVRARRDLYAGSGGDVTQHLSGKERHREPALCP